MRTKTILNKVGQIVAKLYILPNGNLHPDSWLCPDGKGEKLPGFKDIIGLYADDVTVIG